MAKTKKKPKEYTQKEIKKYGLCKHHLVGYKQLKTLVRKQQKYIVNQDKILDRLSKDIENKSNMMNLWMTNRQTWTDKINKDLLQKAENHAKEKKEIKEHYEKELAEVNKLYEEAVETNREIVEINRDAIKTNREIIKSHNEITRAYNGLHSVGEFAQDLGIDIKKHNKMLPENNPDYDFSQKHTLLESGKVRHEYKLTPKNPPKKFGKIFKDKIKKSNGEDK
jgi:DNA repair ATPase RecN|tara:strand:+ start:456 stop:1124 length:669 start_codon:yes stop_codon:yes gene_type:complete